jgi:hypothetical protein
MTMPIQIASSDLNADQRCQAIATILARGVLRYHRRIMRLTDNSGENSLDLSPQGLEVFDKMRLTVPQRSDI